MSERGRYLSMWEREEKERECVCVRESEGETELCGERVRDCERQRERV